MVEEDLVQRVECETNSLDYFKKFLETTVRTMFKPTKESPVVVTIRYCDFGRKKKFVGGRNLDSSNPRQNPEPSYLHVCSIAADESIIFKGAEMFNDCVQLVQRVMDHLKSAAEEGTFFERCGDGYHPNFTRENGGVGYGYRLDNISSRGSLDISICHIEYGKEKGKE